MPVLTIVPLSLPGCLSPAARETALHAPRLFLQTAEHPSARFLREADVCYTAMDDLYRQSEDFDALNAAIAARLTEAPLDTVYAVPGRGPGAAQSAAIAAAAQAAGFTLLRLPGLGYAEGCMAALPGAAPDRYAVCAAASLATPLDPATPLFIEELDTPLRATAVKLALMEYYPDDFPVCLAVMDDAGRYAAGQLPLYALDRQPAEAFFASTVLFVPAAAMEARTRYGMEDLLAVMRRLRAPGGCPWDAEQTHESLRKSLLEEAYEVLDALDAEDADALCEELGDLLLQIVFHAQLEEEKCAFTMRDVTTGIVSKLIYRHPHVFAQTKVKGAEDVLVNWEKLKKAEKHMATQAEVIDAIPRALPALMRAQKVQKKARDVGFDWDAPEEALAKVYEEAKEVEQVLHGDADARREELGDLLFACVNVARLCKEDCELTLRQATDKFADRFKRMEAKILAEGKDLADMSLAEMDEYWEFVKK